MRLLATIRIAVRALRRNKMRTVLTMLGMIIGVAAVIAMVGLGNGAKSQVESQIASFGRNVVLVWSGSLTRGGLRSGQGFAGTLSIEDAESIQREVPGVTLISPEVRGGAQIAAGNQDWSTRIWGESDEYFELRQWPFALGAAFTSQDVRGGNKVAVIGQTIRKQLYNNDDPVGQVLRIRNVPFIVVGVLAPKGLSVQGEDQDDIVITPYTSAMRRIIGVTMLRAINVQMATAELVEPAQQQITDLLRQRHRIQPGRDDDFTVRNQQELAEAMTETTRAMRWLVAGIACVSLVVGGIGIMNIMLVSVTERTREIGIRMAVGARGADIMSQFLIEAVTLSVFGGAIGIGFGVLSSKAIEANYGWAVNIPLIWIAAAFLVSVAVGVFFGFYPAQKASRLDPIEALRYE